MLLSMEKLASVQPDAVLDRISTSLHLRTAKGLPSWSRMAKEQVASKPMPATADAGTPASRTASFTQLHTCDAR